MRPRRSEEPTHSRRRTTQGGGGRAPTRRGRSAMPRIPLAERPRLTLEDYIVFFTTRSGKGLKLDHLNQIIYMHAFARLHRAPKPAVVDALRSVELMRPRRSTVPVNATAPPPGATPAAAAALSADEATRDIDDLGWRECPVGSLLSVRAGMRSPTAAAAAAAESPMPISAIAPGSAERISPPSLLSASSPLPPALPASARKKRSPTGKGKTADRAKRRRVVELLTLPSLEMATSAVPQGPSSAHRPSAGEVTLASA